MTESLIGRISGTPWIILAPALQSIAEIAQRETPDPQNLEAWKGLLAPQNRDRQAVAFRPAVELPGARRARLRDGIAIIPVTGPIFRRANLLTDFSGATALSDIALDLQLAREDPRVRGILLEVDSPGGHADGIAEVAATIRAMRGEKPMAAYVDGMAGSAAYWLASAADRLVLAPTAVVGSLGAVAIFPPDKPGQAKPLEIVSSQTPNKRASPHTDAGRAQLQALIDSLAQVFLEQAADNRGLSVDALLAATDGGGLVLGAAAVAGGLADAVGAFESLLAQLAAGDRGSASGARPALPSPVTSTAIGATMADTIQGAAAPDAPKPAPEAAARPMPPALPTNSSEPEPAPPRQAAADPIAAERARVGAILGAQKPAFAALAKLAVDQGWSPDVFAQAQVAAEASAQAAVAGLTAFRASLPDPVQTAPAGAPVAQTPEEKAQAEWDGDAGLQAEFGGNFAAFAAYRKAEADGRIRRLTRKAG